MFSVVLNLSALAHVNLHNLDIIRPAYDTILMKSNINGMENKIWLLLSS
jgi:hypothetical protein